LSLSSTAAASPAAVSVTSSAALIAQTITPGTAATLTASAALAQLAALPVKGRAPKTGYTRAQFGAAWTDDNGAAGGHNGCDTRNDILRRDLVSVVLDAGSKSCTVLSGLLHDPYTGKTITFSRGASTSTAVQVDHMVALSNAWQTGAQQLTAAQRIDLANDPRNLEAVDGPTNEAKGDGDAATWLPPNKSYRCTYVSRQIQVKTSYHLWVTAAEKTAMQQQLANCDNAAATTSTAAAAVVTTPTTSAPATTTPAPLPPAPTTSVPSVPAADVYYKNCAAVKAAGKAPLLAGQPGYRTALDRDGDGVACES